MSLNNESIQLPPSLSELLSAADRQADADGMLCIGGMYPSNKRCAQNISPGETEFTQARDELKKIVTEGLHACGSALISRLHGIAKSFSCEKHGNERSNARRLLYYWLVSDSLPNLFHQMGFTDAREDSSSTSKDKIVRAIDELNHSQMWLVRKCMMKLFQYGWCTDMIGCGDEELKKVLKHEAMKDPSDEHQMRLVHVAKEQWKIWHPSPGAQRWASFSNAPSTPEHPPLTRMPASAPVLGRTGAADCSITQQRGNASAPRLRQGRRRRSALASSSVALVNESSGSPIPAYSGDIDTLANGLAVGRNARRKRSQDCLESPCDRMNQILKDDDEQPTPSRASKTSPLPSDYAPSHDSNRTENGTNYDSEMNISDDQNPITPEDASGPDDQEVTNHVPCIPLFSPPEKAKGAIETTGILFTIMQKKLTENRQTDANQDLGHIYALSIQGHPGYIKIGRSKHIVERIKDLEKCVGLDLELFNVEDHCPVVYHQRVETLVHAELQPFRCKYACHTCRRRTTHHCDPTKDVMHGEWFKIEPVKAKEVIGRWRDWMETSPCPYSGGELNALQRLRINYYLREKRLINMVDKDREQGTESWRWEVFMQLTRWQLLRFQTQIWFQTPRPLRHRSRSPSDTLWEDWKSNLLFSFMFFILSRFLVEVVVVFPSLLAFAPMLALVYSVVLGTFALLYAA